MNEIPLYLLDTNACIRYLNGKAPGIRVKLESLRPAQVFMCSVVKAEMLAGALRSTDPGRSIERQEAFFSRFVSLPFDDNSATVYSEIRAHLWNVGTPIGPYDMLIAAIAIANRLTLVTHNTNEFGRIPNLSVDDWEI